MRKQANRLFTITQRKGETLKSYTQLFDKEMVEIITCNGSIVVEDFRKSMIRENHLNESLMKKVPKTMIEAMS